MPSFKTALKIYLRTQSARNILMMLGIGISILMVVISFRLQVLSDSREELPGLEEAIFAGSSNNRYVILAQAENGAPVAAAACDANAEYCDTNLLSDGSFENQVCTTNDGNCTPTYNQQDRSILTPIDSHVWWVEDHRYQRPEVVPGTPGMTGSGLCQEELTSHGKSYLKMFSRQHRALNGGVCFNLGTPQANLVAGYDVRITQNAFYEPGGVVVPVTVRVGFTSLAYNQVGDESQVSWGPGVTVDPAQYGGYQGRFASASVHASSVGTVSSVCIQAKSTADANGVDTFWDGGFVSTAGGTCDTPNSLNDGIDRGCGGISCDNITGVGTVDTKKYSLSDYPQHWDASSCDIKPYSNGQVLGNGSLAAGLELVQCADSANQLDCGNGSNWVAGHYQTGCVKDVGLLNYLSATNDIDNNILRGTEENPILTQCLLNAYRSITADADDLVDASAPLTLNFTKKFAGLATAKLTGGQEQLLAVPRLGTAAACGSISWDDLDSELIIDPYLLDISDESGNKIYGAIGTESREKGTFLAKSVNKFKALFSKPRSEENEQVVSGVCSSVTGGQAMAFLNTSDTSFFGFADNGGKCEQITEEKIFELTPEQLCDAQFTGNAENEVVGAICNLSNSQFSFSGKKELSALAQGWALQRQDGVCIKKPNICGKQWECGDSQESIYNYCRAAQGTVTSIAGNPYLRWEQTEAISDLELSGLFKALYSAWHTESINTPFAIYHENVGTAANYVASVYDRQHVKGSPGIKEVSKVAPYNTSDPFTGASSDDVSSKPGGDISLEQLQANLEVGDTYTQGEFLKQFVKLNPQEYDPYFPGKLALAEFDGELTESGGASQSRLEFYYPYIGQIPRIMERVSFYLTNNRDPETEIGAVQTVDSRLSGLVLPFCDELESDDVESSNGDCFIRPCALYEDAAERSACMTLPKSAENKNCDPLADFLISQGFDSAELLTTACEQESTNKCKYDKFGINLLTGPGPVHGDDYERLVSLGMGWKLEVVVGNSEGDVDAVAKSIDDFDGISVFRFCNAGEGFAQDQSCVYRTEKTGSPAASGSMLGDFVTKVSQKTNKKFVLTPLNEQMAEHWAGATPAEVNEFYGSLIATLEASGMRSKIVLASPTYNVTHAGNFTNFIELVDQFGFKDEIDIWAINIYNGTNQYSIEDQVTKAKEVFGKYNDKQIGISETGDFDHDMSRLKISMDTIATDTNIRYALLFNAFDNAFQSQWKSLVMTDDEIKNVLGEAKICEDTQSGANICKSEDGMLGTIKIAAEAINTVSPRIIPEIIYSIGLKENLARTLTGDPNEVAQTGITTGNDWNKDGKIEPICTKAYASHEEAWNVGNCEYDVRGPMQFINFTFYNIITGADTKDAMRACTDMLGVDYSIERGNDLGLNAMFEANGLDPDQNDFNRFRVGDNLCASALFIANLGKAVNGGATFLSPEQWQDHALDYADGDHDRTNAVYKAAWYYVGWLERFGDCPYCNDVTLLVQEHLNNGTFSDISYKCEEGIKLPTYTGSCQEIIRQIGNESPFNKASALANTQIEYVSNMTELTCNMKNWTYEKPVLLCSANVSDHGESVEKDCESCPERATGRFRHELHHGLVGLNFFSNVNVSEFAADAASGNGGWYHFKYKETGEWYFATEIVDQIETKYLVPNGLSRSVLMDYIYGDPVAKDELLAVGVDLNILIQERRTYAATPDLERRTPPGLECGGSGGGGTPVTEKVVASSFESRPIYDYEFGDGENDIVFVGGIHGGYELNSSVLAYELIDYFNVNSSDIPSSVTLHIIPSANPDGQFLIAGKEGKITIADIPNIPRAAMYPGRVNGNGVDLNRNWGCNWQVNAEAPGGAINAGTSAFSEPETKGLRDFLLATKPVATIWAHSTAGKIYPAGCGDDLYLPSVELSNVYSSGSGYRVSEGDDFSYDITGDASNWQEQESMAGTTVELTAVYSTEFDKNLQGLLKVFESYGGATGADTDWEIIAQTDGMTHYEKDDTVIIRLEKSRFAPTLVSTEQNPQNLQYHIDQGHEYVINGGFFNSSFHTIGFLKVNNVFIGDAEEYPSENGPGVFAFNNNNSVIVRTEDFSQIVYSNVLESNPLLIWKSKIYTSNVNAPRAKSAIGIDSNGNYYLIVNPNDSDATGALTYKEFADEILASGLSITDVLGLDGGTATGLAINDSGYTLQIKGTRLVPNVIAFDRTSGGGQITPPVGNAQTSVCGVVSDVSLTSLTAAEQATYNTIITSLNAAISQCSSIESARGMKICADLAGINFNGCNDQSGAEPNVNKDGQQMQLVILSNKLLSADSPYLGIQSDLGTYFATATEEGVKYTNGKVVTYPNTLIINLDVINSTAPAFKSESYLKKLWVHEFAHIAQGREIFKTYPLDYLYKYHMESNGVGPDHSVVGRFFEACADEGLSTTSKYKGNTRMANIKAAASANGISSSEVYQACKGDISAVEALQELDEFEDIFTPY